MHVAQSCLLISKIYPSLFSSFLPVCLLATEPTGSSVFFHQSISIKQEHTKHGWSFGTWICARSFYGACMNYWRRGLVLQFLFLPPKRLIVWGIFSWDLIFGWKVHVSVQGSYKHKITNNNFCFGNKATILLKIFQKIVQAGQSHQGRFKPSGYSLAKGIRWEQEALSTKLHDMKEICYNRAYSGVPENIQQEESS